MKILTLICSFIIVSTFSECRFSKPNDNKNSLTIDSGIYSIEQANKGALIYSNHCANCHGKDLHGSEGGTALTGDRFIGKWIDKSLKELFTLTKMTMPKANPQSLNDEEYIATLAYIISMNGYSEGKNVLKAELAALSKIKIITSPAASRVSMQFIPPKYNAGAPSIEADWKQHRGDHASTNYSSLDQIHAGNVKQLKIAWRWKSDNFGPNPEFYFKVTPLMANGIVYTTAGTNRSVVAIDSETGETLWTYRLEEKERKSYVPRQNSGRGVAYWTDTKNNKDRIIYITPGFEMIALDSKSGLPITEFGKNGIIDMKKELDPLHDLSSSVIGSTSPPVIVNDVIIAGSCFPVGLAPSSKKQIRGDVLAFDVYTGKLLWKFHTIPQYGEEGNETWENESWKYTGNTGAWSPLSADPDLGYVYIPLEAATGDFYGGHRPGSNLYSQSLVCLNAKTGKKVWHYQLIHHDIWDYDLPAPPIVADIRVDGKEIKAVVQLTKQAFAFVFDRITGKPVWPIEERPVPPSDVKGEWTSPTQPFPTKPAPYDRQGYHDSILVDFTPEIKKEALQIVKKYKKGPLYTPVSIYNPPNELGTLMLPDAVGGANWQGGVFDPETGILYVSSSTVLRPMSLESAPAVSDMDYVAYMGSSRIGPYGLPLVKPPYGRITAIDLNTGNHKWMIPNANSPSWINTNPALKGLSIPATGMPDRVGMLVTKTLLFAGEGSGLYASDGGGGNKFRAYDKNTGNLIAEIALPANQCGMPMTYSINGKQYIVVAVGAPGHAGELVAMTIK